MLSYVISFSTHITVPPFEFLFLYKTNNCTKMKYFTLFLLIAVSFVVSEDDSNDDEIDTESRNVLGPVEDSKDSWPSPLTKINPSHWDLNNDTNWSKFPHPPDYHEHDPLFGANLSSPNSTFLDYYKASKYLTSLSPLDPQADQDIESKEKERESATREASRKAQVLSFNAKKRLLSEIYDAKVIYRNSSYPLFKRNQALLEYKSRLEKREDVSVKLDGVFSSIADLHLSAEEAVEISLRKIEDELVNVSIKLKDIRHVYKTAAELAKLKYKKRKREVMLSLIKAVQSINKVRIIDLEKSLLSIIRYAKIEKKKTIRKAHARFKERVEYIQFKKTTELKHAKLRRNSVISFAKTYYDKRMESALESRKEDVLELKNNVLKNLARIKKVYITVRRDAEAKKIKAIGHYKNIRLKLKLRARKIKDLLSRYDLQLDGLVNGFTESGATQRQKLEQELKIAIKSIANAEYQMNQILYKLRKRVSKARVTFETTRREVIEQREKSIVTIDHEFIRKRDEYSTKARKWIQKAKLKFLTSIKKSIKAEKKSIHLARSALTNLIAEISLDFSY